MTLIAEFIPDPDQRSLFGRDPTPLGEDSCPRWGTKEAHEARAFGLGRAAYSERGTRIAIDAELGFLGFDRD